MEVKVIGCSNSWTDRPTSSYCINDSILVDCGEGTLKFYKKAKVDFLNIKHIFITHLHSDHTFNLGTFYSYYANYERKEKMKTVTIYGPKGLKDYVDHIKIVSFQCNYTFEDIFNIVEIEDFNKTIEIDEVKVKMFHFMHGNIDDIAYIFDDGKVKVGFSGDLNYQKEIQNFISNLNVVFLECSNATSSPTHLGYNDYIKLQSNNPDKKFFAVHCADSIYQNEKELGIKCAKHGKCYKFNNINCNKK